MYWRTVLFFRFGNVSSVIQRKEMGIMAGLFKKNGRARRIPEKLAQYDDEYLLYCVEKDRVETVLERTLHETDDPKEIIDVTLKTVCEFYGGDWAGVMDIDIRTNGSRSTMTMWTVFSLPGTISS